MYIYTQIHSINALYSYNGVNRTFNTGYEIECSFIIKVGKEIDTNSFLTIP